MSVICNISISTSLKRIVEHRHLNMRLTVLILFIWCTYNLTSAHDYPTTIKPTKQPKGTTKSIIGTNDGKCPIPSEDTIKCIRQWACQYVIRLDLRCLLNGNPLLGNLISITGLTSSGAGGSGGGGILGNLLGGKK